MNGPTSNVTAAPGSAWLRWLRTHVALDLTPLRVSRDYRLLFTGQFVSAFGTSLTFVVLPWQMFKLTGSTLLVGLLGVAEFVPMLLLGLMGGALADAVDRRKLILGAECGLAACCAVLTANALLPAPHVWVLFAGAAWSAGCNAIHRPALDSLTPRLVPPEHLAAVSALSTLRAFTYIVGPAVAGVIATAFGAALAFAINFGTYLIAITTLFLIRSVPVPREARTPGLQAIAEGLKYARARPELLGTYLIDINAMFFAMPIALFPALAEKFGGRSLGLLYAMLALGPLLVSLTSGWTARVGRQGRAIVIAVVIWGVAIIGFGATHNLWLALTFLLVAGAADGASGIFRMTLWNQTIPDRLRGRLAGIEMISYLTGPYLGNAQVGVTATLVGLRTGIMCGGAACIAGTGLLVLLLPGFYRYERREGIARRQAEEAAAQAS